MGDSAGRWRRVEEVCQAALARDAADRPAFIAAACGGDSGLRREVEALLARESAAAGFLSAPLAAVAADALNSTAGTSLIGRRLGQYEVLSALGAGGMGEVYRARDTELGREVAIKVLPRAFVDDRERLARFEREARVLAALNNPNIAAIYGLEHFEGGRALVLELVEGETLAVRVHQSSRGLAIREALALARQIADALEAAHEKGIVHRDLKPANIKITPTGVAKVLDFGLAKADSGVAQGASLPELSNSPTLTLGGTRAGVLLGTAAYMSPEQARGQPVDKRADIWAFGCVLYEMLTGRLAFSGATVSDHIAAVLEREPDWTAVPGTTPPAIQRLLRRCLEKDPKRRLHDIADARIEVDEAIARPQAAPASVALRHRWSVLAWLVAGVLAMALAAMVASRRAAPPPGETARPVTRFVVYPPSHVTWPTDSVDYFDISRDGTQLVHMGTDRGVSRLYLRRLDQFDAAVVPGTEGARWPFFSPDGQSIGFSANGQLKRVSVSAAASPQMIFDIRGYPMASWAADDTVVFRREIGGGLQRLSANGGVPETISEIDKSASEVDHHSPRMLPGGQALIFTTHLDHNRFRLEVLSPPARQRRTLIEHGFDAWYSPSGHLVYGTRQSLHAVRFDVERLALAGSPVKLLDDVAGEARGGVLNFKLSQTGTLVYEPLPSRSERALVWLDASGREVPLPIARRPFENPRISPDGKRLAFALADGGRRDIWVYDIAADQLTRVTREHDNYGPLWTPDGRDLTYTSIHDGSEHLVKQPDDGSGPAETLMSSRDPVLAGAWTPDGRALLYVETPPTDRSEIRLLSLDGDRSPRRLLHGNSAYRFPTLSPDGRWVAFTSLETGRPEIYVDAFPALGARRQVTVDGGREARWSRDGRQLFARVATRVLAVSVNTTGGFSAGKPVPLFEGRYAVDFAPEAGLDYDLAADGRFLMIKPSEEEQAPRRLNVVVNWVDELARRVPTGR